jgi:transposase
MVGVQDKRDRRLEKLEAQVALLLEENARLRARVAELEAKLAENSSNSNRPPSSDTPADRGARPGKPPTGRSRGGQPGHKGWKRALLSPDKVNRTNDIYPDRCRRRGCGKRLPHQPDANPIRHQVVEVPPISPDVTEYRLHRVACDCGKITCGTLPAGVPRGMCGPRLTAFIGLLSGNYKLSRRDAANFLSDVLGVKISLGALSESEDDVSEAIAAPVEEARVHVSEQGVKNADATGWRQAGEGRTLWTIATPLVVFFGIAVNGSRAGLRGLFATVRGILVTDRGTQFGFWAMKARQICWAHLTRRFVGFAERSGPAGELGDALLLWSQTIFHWWHQVRDGTLSRRRFREIMNKARPVVEGLLEQGVALGVRGVSGCCQDILAHRLALWTFVDHDGVEPTNNSAERALRAFVCWRKMCFGSQSERGNRFAARIMTVTQTLRKQRRHVLDFLTQAVQSKLLGRKPPSLLPAMATP